MHGRSVFHALFAFFSCRFPPSRHDKRQTPYKPTMTTKFSIFVRELTPTVIVFRFLDLRLATCFLLLFLSRALSASRLGEERLTCADNAVAFQMGTRKEKKSTKGPEFATSSSLFSRLCRREAKVGAKPVENRPMVSSPVSVATLSRTPWEALQEMGRISPRIGKC